MASKPQTPNPSSGSPNSTGRRKPIRRVSPPEEERNPENSLPRDDNEDSAIASVIEEFGEVIMEDPLEILEDPAIAVELSEDPVRLYLKEIGLIHLLDSDSEFRLAARIEAQRRIDAHQLHVQPPPGKPGHHRSLFLAITQDLIADAII